MYMVHPISANILSESKEEHLFPATHYVVSDGMEQALVAINTELKSRVKELEQQGRSVEAPSRLGDFLPLIASYVISR